MDQRCEFVYKWNHSLLKADYITYDIIIIIIIIIVIIKIH